MWGQRQDGGERECMCVWVCVSRPSMSDSLDCVCPTRFLCPLVSPGKILEWDLMLCSYIYISLHFLQITMVNAGFLEDCAC